MALNLSRNSKVYFTTNVNSTTGVVQTSGFAAANTYEIQVLDGFSFSQSTNQDTVTISEAGVAPVRGQRAFNASLAPVDFSMSTYIRPFNSGSAVTAEESVLWNTMFSDKPISAANTITVGGTVSTAAYVFNNTTGQATITITGTAMTYAGAVVDDWVVIGGLVHGSDGAILNASAKITSLSATSITLDLANPKASGAAITSITISGLKFYRSAWAQVATTYSIVTAGGSNLNQLQKFGLIFVVDNAVYVIDNCAMNQVAIDFGLEAIATAAWTGQGTALNQSTVITPAALVAGSTAKNTAAQFITNKLSTVSLSLVNAIGAATAGTQYAVAITGGSITISNNITYVTPANIGVVNIPVTYYTGTRSITGTINAYLKTGVGAGSTGQLLADMLAAASSTVEPMATMSIAIGGATNTTKVVLDMPAISLTIPSVDVQQVVSTAINFTAGGSTPNSVANTNVFALDETNDLSIRYFA